MYTLYMSISLQIIAHQEEKITDLETENGRLKAQADKVTSQEEEIRRLMALVAAKDSEISQLKDGTSSKTVR